MLKDPYDDGRFHDAGHHDAREHDEVQKSHDNDGEWQSDEGKYGYDGQYDDGTLVVLSRTIFVNLLNR